MPRRRGPGAGLEALKGEGGGPGAAEVDRRHRAGIEIGVEAGLAQLLGRLLKQTLEGGGHDDGENGTSERLVVSRGLERGVVLGLAGDFR